MHNRKVKQFIMCARISDGKKELFRFMGKRNQSRDNVAVTQIHQMSMYGFYNIIFILVWHLIKISYFSELQAY